MRTIVQEPRRRKKRTFYAVAIDDAKLLLSAHPFSPCLLLIVHIGFHVAILMTGLALHCLLPRSGGTYYLPECVTSGDFEPCSRRSGPHLRNLPSAPGL